MIVNIHRPTAGFVMGNVDQSCLYRHVRSDPAWQIPDYSKRDPASRVFSGISVSQREIHQLRNLVPEDWYPCIGFFLFQTARIMYLMHKTASVIGSTGEIERG